MLCFFGSGKCQRCTRFKKYIHRTTRDLGGGGATSAVTEKDPVPVVFPAPSPVGLPASFRPASLEEVVVPCAPLLLCFGVPPEEEPVLWGHVVAVGLGEEELLLLGRCPPKGSSMALPPFGLLPRTAGGEPPDAAAGPASQPLLPHFRPPSLPQGLVAERPQDCLVFLGLPLQRYYSSLRRPCRLRRGGSSSELTGPDLGGPERNWLSPFRQ